MSVATVRQLQQLFALVPTPPWEWRAVSSEEGPAFELVQPGAPRTHVYSVGATLSRQARWVGAMSPAFLTEVAEVCEGQTLAVERLQQVAEVLARHLRRCYRHGHRKHYEDLRLIGQEIQATLKDLQAPESAAKMLLEAFEEVQARG